MRWEGADEFAQWLRYTAKVTPDKVAAALYREAELIMAESKKRTPVDTGNLRATGHVKPPTVKGGKAEVVLAYGTEYAIYVHEIPASHPTGQSKFLESAMKQAMPGLTKRLRNDILGQMGRR